MRDPLKYSTLVVDDACTLAARRVHVGASVLVVPAQFDPPVHPGAHLRGFWPTDSRARPRRKGTDPPHGSPLRLPLLCRWSRLAGTCRSAGSFGGQLAEKHPSAQPRTVGPRWQSMHAAIRHRRMVMHSFGCAHTLSFICTIAGAYQRRPSMGLSRVCHCRSAVGQSCGVAGCPSRRAS
jgi:hypothetical protein